MSGLEALSIACNIMQVISFAHETIDFCKEIYHGGSLNDYNQQSIVSLVELSRQLQTRFQKAKSKTAEETQLANIAQKCNVAARALQEEVKFLESRHAKGNLAATIKIVVKTYWRKSRLERLEKSLRNHQNTMESYLLARVCTQNDAIEIQQSQEFKELGKDIKFFTSQYAAGHTRIVDLIKKELVLRMDQCTIESNIKSSTKEQKDQFLNSLRYEGMNQRKNDVTGSFKDTFQWIFDSECGKTPIQLWDNFGDWLKSESNIYWISGKPGSGKSTLMKYLLKSPSTEEALKIWNTGPIILSHFFWKPGFKMQKSIKGFLCSILHQALLSDRVSITLDSILNTSKPLLLKHEAADWDVEELKDLYFTILGTDMFPVCIFLDGLDEICDEDGPFSLLKLIDDLRIHPKVKICVSSRPEPELQSKLCRHQQLKLHDLTHDDMKKFVVGQIQPYINSGKISESFGSKITWSLIWKAEGVFLWLHLASRSLIGGIDKGDTEDILWQRLEEMPNELTKLYSDMWERMNGNSKIYRETAARYFNLLILTREQNLGYTRPGSELRFFQFMGATQTELQDIILEKQSSVSEATFEHIYALSVQAIQVRCAGLLEVNCNNYLDKFLCVRDPTHFNFFKRQNMQVQFIHRTAYDFIKDTEEGHRICAYDSSSSDILRIQLIKGHLIMIRLLWETRDFELLLAKCIGQTVEIPDLFVLCPWDMDVSPVDEKLEREVELWRSRWINDATSLKRNRIVNSCLFARGIAPKATFDELVTVAKYQAWLFYWDDAYDFGDFDDKYEEIVAHQKQTIELLRESLFNEHPSSIDPVAIAPDYLTAQSIHEWGVIVGEKSVSSSLKNWFFKVLINFITATFHLQSEFDKGSILDLETYWKIRMDSSAVFPTLGMVLFADQVAFPLWFFDHTLVQKAAELSNIIIWV
ncbi:hypothetical protein GL218_00238 [Daldinia childiae]|uniref:uncharacterized protein n=1 Tax=Daldinia childiae TaxID=326645 RepID=UPI001448078D|nr:uncharacterized protein GL218_00238 [Daldinia childiae]KAF3070671.1 hypothetical protein GL218_00238 [Daldinia childiae]